MSAAQVLTEQPLFLGSGDERVFAFMHSASQAAKGTIVMCHAFAEEKLWSHRVYVTFAREAAAAGFNVARFDMRGEGDSALDFEQSTIESRVTDTLRVIAAAQEHWSVEGVVLLGHRLGGSIAAVAQTHAGRSVRAVAIWDPIVDGEDYFGQLLRSNMATQMATQGKVTRMRDALVKAILDGETVVADGYGLTAELYRGIAALKWAQQPELFQAPGLLIEVPKGEQTAPSPPLASLAATRPELKLTLAAEPPFWRETKQFHRRAARFTTTTLEWLNGQPA
jgi:pimeloyl-ACP methyl ester carboxylesterase